MVKDIPDIARNEWEYLGNSMILTKRTQKRTFASLVALTLALSLSGCSAAILAGINNIGTSEENLKAATAKYFNVSEGSVRISNIQNGVFGATYKARVRGVTYNCGANTGNVNCSRPGA